MSSPVSDRANRDWEHFDRIADSYFKKDLRPAHRLARQLRLRQTLAAVPVERNAAVLEIGCGAGFAARYLQGHYARYVGVDYSEELVAHARRLHDVSDAEFIAGDANCIALDEAFDVIVMIGLLHHLPEPARTLRALRASLKPGGWVVANEPQRGNRLVSLLRRARMAVDAAYSSEQDEYSRDELQEIYEEAGLVEISIIPQGVFSTPFAEVVMPFQRVATLASGLACAADRALERYLSTMLYPLSWNLIAAGRAPLGR